MPEGKAFTVEVPLKASARCKKCGSRSVTVTSCELVIHDNEAFLVVISEVARGYCNNCGSTDIEVDFRSLGEGHE